MFIKMGSLFPLTTACCSKVKKVMDFLVFSETLASLIFIWVCMFIKMRFFFKD